MESDVNYKKEVRKYTNLTKEEEEGRKRLLKRVRDGEIVVSSTDKTGKLVVTKPATYSKALEVHTAKDLEVDWKELEKTEKLVNRHARIVKQSTGLGEDHPGKERRMAGALFGQDTGAPSLYVMWKEHKEDFYTKMQTRLECNGNIGPLPRISEVLSRLIRGILDGLETKVNCSSTKEMLQSVQDANKETVNKNLENIFIFGMNVKALYPSMDVKDVVECVEDIMKTSKN